MVDELLKFSLELAIQGKGGLDLGDDHRVLVSIKGYWINDHIDWFTAQTCLSITYHLYK